MPHSILVTGGAGFIGSHFVRFVLGLEDIRVVNLDALTYAGNLESLEDVITHPRHVFVHGNIGDTSLVRRLCVEHEIQGIVNFAAESHVDRSIENPGIFVETNVSGTVSLLNNARDLGLRFLQISTDEVYGSLGEVGQFTESSQIQPNSPYAASKAAADGFVRSYYKTYGVDARISRCSNNYGPFQFPEKLIPLMVIRALNNMELPLYGSGQQSRDWIHVVDHCKALWSIYSNGVAGGVYNIGSHAERRNIEIVELILDVLGKPKTLVTFVKDRPGHDQRYAMDSTKLQTELGWSPEVDFETGIRETIHWYLANKNWWERVQKREHLEFQRKWLARFQ